MKIDLENDLEKPGVGPFWETGNPDLNIGTGNGQNGGRVDIA